MEFGGWGARTLAAREMVAEILLEQKVVIDMVKLVSLPDKMDKICKVY